MLRNRENKKMEKNEDESNTMIPRQQFCSLSLKHVSMYSIITVQYENAIFSVKSNKYFLFYNFFRKFIKKVKKGTKFSFTADYTT